MQSISALIEAVCRKTLQQVNLDFEAQSPAPRNSVENYVGLIDWLSGVTEPKMIVTRRRR
jgi:hypothetical protein